MKEKNIGEWDRAQMMKVRLIKKKRKVIGLEKE